MEALEYYKNVENVPEWAQKPIQAGRLKGMTDINPQWRILKLVEKFGFCGIGWSYSVKKLWTEKAESETLAFAEIELKIKVKEVWSDPIPGIGGSKMITKESSGMHVSDECYKMAITDALSVACKMLGIGASVYSGSKYSQAVEAEAKKESSKEAIDFVRKCTTESELKATWESYTNLQTDKAFIAAVTAKKTELKIK